MSKVLDECRKYLNLHYLYRIFHPLEDYGLSTDYTVTSYQSSRNESELDHLFIQNNASKTHRLIIMIHEEWLRRCVQSRDNHQEIEGLNEEFNQFILKILDGIAELELNNIIEIGTDLASSNIPALNSPPKPSPSSEITLKIKAIKNTLIEHGGPDYDDHCWIWPNQNFPMG